jgi:DNA-directed RNA polymerase specialized sigma24 family protein
LLRAQDWRALRARLFRYAHCVTHDRVHAEELADAVLVGCCDPEGTPWDPIEAPDLLAFALRVLRDRLSLQRKASRVRQDPRTVAALALGAAPPRTPEEALQEAQHAARRRRLIEAARACLSEALDEQVLALSLDGVDRPSEQAARLGVPVEEVRRARERVKYALRAAMAKHDEASDGEATAFTR